MSANVIKARASGSMPPISSIKKEVHEASLEAKEIVKRAEERAAQVIEQAEREKEGILTQSAERGYSAGLDKWNDALTEAWRLRDQDHSGRGRHCDHGI